MGIFTDQLNKLKSKAVPFLPNVKDTLSLSNLKNQPTPMTFPVGQNISPAQNTVAQETVRKSVSTPNVLAPQGGVVSTLTNNYPGPFVSSTAEAIKTKSFIPIQQNFQTTREKRNTEFDESMRALTDKSIPEEERKVAIERLTNPVLGSTGNLYKYVPKNFLSDKVLKRWANEVNPLKILDDFKKAKVPANIAGDLAEPLSRAKTIDEVKRIIANYEPGITPRPPVQSKILLTGRETPQEILALAESKAGLVPKPDVVKEALDARKARLTEEGFIPKPITPEQYEMRKLDLELRKEASQQNPVAALWKYADKKNDVLPEATGTGKSIFRREGDTITGREEFQGKDNEQVRREFEAWREEQIAIKAEEKALKELKPHLKFDARTGKPIPYEPWQQAIVDGKVAPKPIPLPSPRPSQLDTTTGEGRSLEIAASREPGYQIPKKIVDKDDSSLINIISKEPTLVKDKVNIIDYIRTPDRVLKKIGLEKEGDILRTQHERYLQELPGNIDKITAWSKKASSTGNRDIFRWLDGEAIDLKPQDKQVALEIKDWLSQWADRLGLPQDGRIAHYITHIFDQELIAKEFPEELAKLIDKKIPGEVYDPFLQERLGALGYKQDTWAALDAYVKRATRKVHMDPALEAIKDVSAQLEKSQYDYVQTYVNNINMRPSKLDNLLDNGIKQVIGYKLGQRPLLTITKFLRQMTYRAMLGLNPASALKNLSQGINTYAKLGEKYTTIGYINLFKKGAKKELEAEGILNAGFIEDRALSATKKTLEKFDKTLFFFFEKAEHINRGAAYFGAKAQGLAQGMNEQQAVKYAKKIVRDTQFVFGKVDTPIVLSSDLGKTVGQFQSFTTKQIEFLSEMGRRAVKGDQKAKNLLGLIRYAVAGTVFVYTIGQAFNMKPKDLIPLFRFGTPPSLKLPVEVGKAAVDAPGKYGNDRDAKQKLKDISNTLWGIVPAGTQAKKTIQGVKALREGKAKDSSGRSQYDVGGTPAKNVQAVIFGKYAGAGAQDYYENDTTYAEATLKRIMESQTPGDDFAKIVEENPALAENLIKTYEDQALGLTDEEKKIRNMGVATKERANEIVKKYNKLDTEYEKNALLIDYLEKKIITEDVAAQLLEMGVFD